MMLWLISFSVGELPPPSRLQTDTHSELKTSENLAKVWNLAAETVNLKQEKTRGREVSQFTRWRNCVRSELVVLVELVKGVCLEQTHLADLRNWIQAGGSRISVHLQPNLASTLITLQLL